MRTCLGIVSTAVVLATIASPVWAADAACEAACRTEAASCKTACGSKPTKLMVNSCKAKCDSEKKACYRTCG